MPFLPLPQFCYSVSEAVAPSEQEALRATGEVQALASDPRPVRRLRDFSAADAQGDLAPLERLEFAGKGGLRISGAVYPASGKAEKELGRRVDTFGPVTGWGVEGVEGAQAHVVITTAKAKYVLEKPAGAYRKTFKTLADLAALSREVYRVLSPACGGNPEEPFESAVARITRTRALEGSFADVKQQVVLCGHVLLDQLRGLEHRLTVQAKKPVNVVDLPFCAALAGLMEERFFEALAGSGGGSSGGVSISSGAGRKAKPYDEKAARRAFMDERLALQMSAHLNKPKGQANPANASGQPGYVKVDFREIASDYPGRPDAYKLPAEEMDEVLLFGDDTVMDLDPVYLPQRVLSDFAIYDADSFFTTLELLPMWNGVDPDMPIYASGSMTEDADDWGNGIPVNGPTPGSKVDGEETEEEDEGAGGSGAGPAGGAGGAGFGRLFLSEIREWMVEFGADMIYIKARTDFGWYKLVNPLPEYRRWFDVVVKVARVAVKILGWIADAKRAASLSLGDVVKLLAALSPEDPCYIARNATQCERFLAVHAQIILNQFRHYPVRAVAQSAFAQQLKRAMEACRHSKLYHVDPKARKALGRRARASNPMKDRAYHKLKPMKATTTKIVYKVWESYFRKAYVPGGEDAETAAATEAERRENERKLAGDGALAYKVEPQEQEEEEEEEEERALAEKAELEPLIHVMDPCKVAGGQVKWGEPAPASAKGAKTAKEAGAQLFRGVNVAGRTASLGDVLAYSWDADAESPELGLVQCLWETKKGAKMARVWRMLFGSETVISDCAGPLELFLVPETREVRLDGGGIHLWAAWKVQRKHAQATFKRPAQQLQEMMAEEAEAQECLAAKRQLPYFFRKTWEPERACFADLPDLREGDFTDPGPAPQQIGVRAPSRSRLIKDGREYRVGDFICLASTAFGDLREEVPDNIPAYAVKGKGTWKGGSNAGHRAFNIVQLLRVEEPGAEEDGGRRGAKARAERDVSLLVRRFYRPEDISSERAYKCEHLWEIFSSDAEATVSALDVVRPCFVVGPGQAHLAGAGLDVPVFLCTHTVHPKAGQDSAKWKLSKAPADLVAVDEADVLGTAVAGGAKNKSSSEPAPKKRKIDKGKGQVAVVGSAPAGELAGGNRAPQSAADGEILGAPCSTVLRTMDIFAGCGGLSEGMHQAKVAETRWAVEYDECAARAFQLNNGDAAVFAENCNVVLRRAMEKAGREDDCSESISQECKDQARELREDVVEKIPLPGEVDFICGGPPCQGFSGMNRFNKRTWSKVQNEMILAYLSYADLYRPRFFLLENVRNFVSHNKSFQFKLTVRSLISMGYQVRFGVLNAGNYGVAQSRKRAFVYGAAPGEVLPEWPMAQNVFRSAQLSIGLPGGHKFLAADTKQGALLRAVTVRDTIGDLPTIANGDGADVGAEDVPLMPYARDPESCFQRDIRGGCTEVSDHICKLMNELNFARCQVIPKLTPGADWHELEELVARDPSKAKFRDSSGAEYDLVPWCLANHTRKVHNEWRGLYGRLDYNGHFPTSVTEPQPMGKVGQVFHPEQDRIVSVRECARSQGFPDSFKFYGTVHHRHRQIGNAVPPPLALALGRRLKASLQQKKAAQEG